MAEKKYTKGELAKKTPKELRDLAEKTEQLETEGITSKAAFIALLLEVEVPEELEEELEDEVDEELTDEEEPDIEADEVDDIEEPAPAKKSTAKKSAPAKGEGNTLAAKQVAAELGTEAKTLRQFFRSPASTIEPVGSGGRYEFEEADLPQIKQEFEAWKSGHASRGSKRTGEGSTRSRNKRGPKVAEVTEVEEVEELEIEELEDAELDDEELELEDED